MDVTTKLIRPNITGTVRTPASQKTKSTTKFSATADSSAEAKSQQAHSSFGVTALDGLFLNLQERGNNHQQAIEYGQTLLNELEKLRLMLLDNSISPSQLHRLQHLLKEKPDLALPPDLADLINEIEIRTAVELAKIQRDS